MKLYKYTFLPKDDEITVDVTSSKQDSGLAVNSNIFGESFEADEKHFTIVFAQITMNGLP